MYTQRIPNANHLQTLRVATRFDKLTYRVCIIRAKRDKQEQPVAP
jgi:hypothetical protein